MLRRGRPSKPLAPKLRHHHRGPEHPWLARARDHVRTVDEIVRPQMRADAGSDGLFYDVEMQQIPGSFASRYNSCTFSSNSRTRACPCTAPSPGRYPCRRNLLSHCHSLDAFLRVWDDASAAISVNLSSSRNCRRKSSAPFLPEIHRTDSDQLRLVE